MTQSESASPRAVRRRTIFRGRVQGVGFRYTASRIARHFDVVGCVRNCPDGTVELVAHGTPGVLDAFLKRIREEFAGHIAGEATEEIPIAGDFESFDRFEIRR